ncbi:hypothetical protein [Kitasatospora sp. MAA19]|uniref:hypothetical protein n=1 Tax=Kitasatospora sp. MAA19 TaxID=3035090 RepID=UPI002476E731|nr:hypothetical protein [Kitasatospora sp. MAA19]
MPLLPALTGLDDFNGEPADFAGYSTRGTTARLSPFVRHHINLGRHSFQLPDLPGGMRPLRALDADDVG